MIRRLLAPVAAFALAAPDTLHLSLPGFPPMDLPVGNPTTRQGVALGRRLFYDRALSGDGTQSCGDCHAPPFAFSDHGFRFSTGIDGLEGDRNASAIINPGWLPALFWDGRSATLEAQALEPVENPIEMHTTWDHAISRLGDDPRYGELFGRAFGSGEITRERAVQAIAQFERTFLSNGSRYDRFLRNQGGLSESELRGYRLFFTEKGDCFYCHGNIMLTDNLFHNNGLDADIADTGLGRVTGNAADDGKFKTPTLRNIAVSAPYMHDGRFATLEEVVEHYNAGGVSSPTVHPLIRVGRGLGLSEAEVGDLVAYVKTFTDSTFLANPDLAPPAD